jgi:phosphomannomutase
MERVYLFDVDGTLTHPRQPIDEAFADIFLTWLHDKKKKAYLVTGSDLEKIEAQLFGAFLDQCAGVFTCSGNVFYVNNHLMYENKLELPSNFISDLELYLENSIWRRKTGNHIELRQGMVNFSVVGRNASPKLREAYSRWDTQIREREDIIEYIMGLYPELEVSIGGQISVDIYPRGHNKGMVVEKLQELHGKDVSMIFVGDRNLPGGNDWPLAQKLESLDNCKWFQVTCYEETRALIEYSELFT